MSALKILSHRLGMVRRTRFKRSVRTYVTPPKPAPAWTFGLAGMKRTLSQSMCSPTMKISKAFSEAVPEASVLLKQEEVEFWEDNVVGDPTLSLPRGDDWWTGVPPPQCPGYVGKDSSGYVTSLAIPNAATATRQDLLDYLDNTWTLTEILFAGLAEEAFYRPPYHDLRHPMIFYYGHTASVYINKFRVAGLLSDPLNPYFEHIFETGVDEMTWDDLSKNAMRWPTVAEVKKYRQSVYNLVRDVIASHPAFDSLHAEVDPSSNPFWAVLMGFEHERIHLETSSVLVRELPLHCIQRPPHWPPNHPGTGRGLPPSQQPAEGLHYPENPLVPVKGTTVRLGKPRDFPSFGWDNEYGSKEIEVAPFKASKYFVTNGEFLEFVKDGGYLNESLWGADGWGWRCFRNIKWPTFWVPTGPSGLNQFKLRTVWDVVDMPWDCPINLNYHEGKAFAAWKSKKAGLSGARAYRLPTEAEHNAMRDPALREEVTRAQADKDPVVAATGQHMADTLNANLNLGYGSESPVTAMKPNSHGLHDTFGNVWHWCEDHFSPLTGFKTHHTYADFSIPCFDGEHNMILGGSFASTGDEASVFARFHFRPHFFQHAGLRLVEPNPENPTLVTSCMDNQGPFAGTENPFRSSTSNKYEQQSLVDQYLHLHYHANPQQGSLSLPPELQGLLDFPRRCADLLTSSAVAEKAPTGTALDLGCAVGASSFNMAKLYKEVVGIDLSAAFIDAANALKANGAITAKVLDEGSVTESFTAAVPTGVDVNRVRFQQGDATALPTSLGSFDGLLAANLFCRLQEPQALLDRLSILVNARGIMVTTSPFTWREEFTPRTRWLGGYKDDQGNVMRSRDGLIRALEPAFELLHEQSLPLLIREHARKYELILTHAAVWRRHES